MTAIQPPKCGECGAPMVLRTTPFYRYPGSKKPRKFYGCSQWPRCRGTHGAQPDGRPLGVPADKATKDLRVMAHQAFHDWRGRKGLKKEQGYHALEKHFGKPVHIGESDAEACRQIIALCTADSRPQDLLADYPETT